MSSDRKIQLEVNTTGIAGRQLQQDQGSAPGGHLQDEHVDPQTREEFERALEKNDPADKKTDEKTTQAFSDADSSLPSPFSLLGAPVPSSAPDRLQGGLAQIEQTIERLMVSDNTDGRRQVRIDLKEEVLSGVAVNIFEDEGRLNVEFCCANQNSMLTLLEQQAVLVQELADRLRREVLMRVINEQTFPPTITEVSAQSNG